jgi:mannose-1-phosphate guanylyltransferase
MPNSRRFSLERDFFPAMVGERLFGYISSGFFLDIGTPERYRRARRHLLKAGISF